MRRNALDTGLDVMKTALKGKVGKIQRRTGHVANPPSLGGYVDVINYARTHRELNQIRKELGNIEKAYPAGRKKDAFFGNHLE